MSEPYIRRKSGELLSSAVWNRMQVLAREDVARVQARVDAAKAALDARPGVEEATSEALRKGGVTVVEAEGVGNWRTYSERGWRYDSGWGLRRPDYYDSCVARFRTHRTSLVDLAAKIRWVAEGPGASVYAQFLLGMVDSSGHANVFGPVRVPVGAPWDAAEYGPYSPPTLASPEDWWAWLKYHRGLTMWPVSGVVIGWTLRDYGVSTTGLNEHLVLPAGEWAVQVATLDPRASKYVTTFVEYVSATVVPM